MSLNAGAIITVDEFKNRFDRDFIFGKAMTEVRDIDVENAINESVALFNPGLFGDLTTQKTACLYLTAHVLVLNIKAAGGLKKAGKGINSTGSAAIASKSAGPLSVGYSLPQEVADSPVLFQFLKTEYGMKYLQIMVPNLIGNIGIVGGGTQL